jgi:catechol 2,3-dioxygenase-like lactoylglutathione lyase family enzyme
VPSRASQGTPGVVLCSHSRSKGRPRVRFIRSLDLCWNIRLRLNQVTVGATDLARSERFYLTLGLRLIVKDDHYLRFEFPSGDSTFSVERVDAVSDSEQVTVYFESETLDTDYARLRDAGVDFEYEPTDMPWLWRETRLRDPDGHRLCLFHAGPNRHHPPWRLE